MGVPKLNPRFQMKRLLISFVAACVCRHCKAILGVYYSVSPMIDRAVVPGRVVTWGCWVTLSALFFVHTLSGVSDVSFSTLF